MTRAVLIPVGPTEWRSQGRLLGRVELPLAEEGPVRFAEWAERLRPLCLAKLFHGPDELSTITARTLGRTLRVPAKALDGLVEVDLGLWAGLTTEQLKARYATAYRQLIEDPLAVSPPCGEHLSAAAARLDGVLAKRVRRNGKGLVGLVLRPLSYALARTNLENAPARTVLEKSQTADEPLLVEAHDGVAVSPRE